MGLRGVCNMHVDIFDLEHESGDCFQLSLANVSAGNFLALSVNFIMTTMIDFAIGSPSSILAILHNSILRRFYIVFSFKLRCPMIFFIFRKA